MEFETLAIPADEETIDDSPMVEGDSNIEEVQTQELPQQLELIANSKPKRTIKKPACFIDMVACVSLIVADDIPATYNEVIQSSEEEK